MISNFNPPSISHRRYGFGCELGCQPCKTQTAVCCGNTSVAAGAAALFAALLFFGGSTPSGSGSDSL